MEENIRVNGMINFYIHNTIINKIIFRHKKTGLKDGMGIMFWSDGIKYEGQFKADK